MAKERLGNSSKATERQQNTLKFTKNHKFHRGIFIDFTNVRFSHKTADFTERVIAVKSCIR